MKQLYLALITATALLLGACGSSSNSNATINGNWTASLTNSSNNTSAFSFNTSLNQTSNAGTVSVSNLAFNTQSPCFASGATATGAFTVSGNFSGNSNGSFQMIVTASGNPPVNTLTLSGTLTNSNTISGNWTLTGTSSCTGSGTFVMTRK